jgi:hypothetical protein
MATSLGTAQLWRDLPRELVTRNLAVVETLPLARYRLLLSYPVWNMWTTFLRGTRSYQQSLDMALILLRAAYFHHGKIDDKESARYLKLIFGLVLTSLDRLDRWDQFLSLADILMRVESLYDWYAANSRASHGQRFPRYVLSEKREFLKVHFLWGLDHRTRIIERRWRGGKPDDYAKACFTYKKTS